jgi:hypothetical protein
MRKIVERIGFRVGFCLYGVAAGFYLLRYNNGLDTGVPGYLAALQLEWLGSADERITIWATMAVFLVPFLIVAAMVAAILRRTAPRPRDAGAKPLPDWPGNLLSGAAIVAILAVSAHFFLTDEIERTSSAKIYQLNLNDSEKLPSEVKFVSAIGRIQGDYLYIIEKTRSGGTERTTVYAPFTGRRWTPDQPVAYIVQLHHGYVTKPSADGKSRAYSIAQDDAEKTAARPLEAELSTSGVPIAVARSLAQEDHLKLADKLYLLEQTGFPGGKPLNKYEDVVSLLPWLLPAGLPISAVLLLAGLVGLLFGQRQRQAA